MKQYHMYFFKSDYISKSLQGKKTSNFLSKLSNVNPIDKLCAMGILNTVGC